MFQQQSAPSPKGLATQRRRYRNEESRYMSQWKASVRHFNGLLLTREGDRLAALSGLAQTRQLGPSTEYLAGLWETTYSSFVDDLCWKIDEDSEVSYRRRPSYCAPSWSWASVSGMPTRSWSDDPSSISGILPWTWPEEWDVTDDSSSRRRLIQVLDVGVRPRGSDPTGVLDEAFRSRQGSIIGGRNTL